MAEKNKKYKYIHVFNGSNYGTINSFTALINKRFDPAEHLIIVKDKKNNPKETISCYENVIWLPGAEHELPAGGAGGGLPTLLSAHGWGGRPVYGAAAPLLRRRRRGVGFRV